MRSVEEHQRIVLGDAGPLPSQRVPLLDADDNNDPTMRLNALAPLVDWASRMAGFWESRFDKLEDLLARMDQ